MYVKNLQMLKTKECANKTKEVASPHIGVLGERMREKNKEVANPTLTSACLGKGCVKKKLRKSRLQLTSACSGKGCAKKKKELATPKSSVSPPRRRRLRRNEHARRQAGKAISKGLYSTAATSTQVTIRKTIANLETQYSQDVVSR